MSQTILVSGGAGYVGSHVCLRLAEAGYVPVVYDNLSNGHESSVQWGAFEQGDVCDAQRLDGVFAKYRPAAVLHFAALIEVGESVKHPDRFYQNNVAGTLCLIEAARRASVGAMVFSSTCAIYGEPVHLPMREDHPQAPINPYGRSKLMVERILADYDQFLNFRSVCLRYFNAAGADLDGRIGERHEPETHAIPLAIEAAMGKRPGFKLFGEDYDTRDGTAVRDYIHVLDLADAHVLALEHLLAGGKTDAFNLGTGTGTTVKELISMIEEVSGKPFAVESAPRRDGDAPMLVADNSRAENLLGWSPRYDLRDIVRSAWAWHSQYQPALNRPVGRAYAAADI